MPTAPCRRTPKLIRDRRSGAAIRCRPGPVLVFEPVDGTMRCAQAPSAPDARRDSCAPRCPHVSIQTFPSILSEKTSSPARATAAARIAARVSRSRRRNLARIQREPRRAARRAREKIASGTRARAARNGGIRFSRHQSARKASNKKSRLPRIAREAPQSPPHRIALGSKKHPPPPQRGGRG